MDKIIIIAPNFPASEISISGPAEQQAKKLAYGLIQSGYLVTIYTHSKTNFKNLDIRYIKKRRPTNFIINFISNWTWPIIVASSIKKNFKNENINLITRCYPLYAHFVPLFLSKKKYNWLAYWEDPAPARLHMPPLGLGLDAKLNLYQKLILRTLGYKATFHGFPAKRLSNYMQKFLNNNTNKNVFIPHLGLEPEKFENNELNNLKFVHLGSAYYRNWKEVILAVYVIKNENNIIADDIEITFYGWQPNEAKELVEKLNMKKYIKFHDSTDIYTAINMLQKFDCLLLLETNFEEGIYSASKIADYALSKKPIFAISPKNGEIFDLYKEFDDFYYADCSDLTDIKENIYKIHKDWLSKNLHFSKKLNHVFKTENVLKSYTNLFS